MLKAGKALMIDSTKLTRHATVRMAHRRTSAEVIEKVIEYGRTVYTRGAVVHAIGPQRGRTVSARGHRRCRLRRSPGRVFDGWRRLDRLPQPQLPRTSLRSWTTHRSCVNTTPVSSQGRSRGAHGSGRATKKRTSLADPSGNGGQRSAIVRSPQ